MTAKTNLLIILLLAPKLAVAMPKPLPDREHAILSSNFIKMGETPIYTFYYDKNITYYTQRQQAIFYLLVETKSPQTVTFKTWNGNNTSHLYRFMMQRTSVDCRGFYIADLVTYFEEKTGNIVYEGYDGTSHKTNPDSIIGKLITRICAEMS